MKKVTKEEIEKEINKLSKKKVSQNSDILTRTVKENSDIFEYFLCKIINSTFKSLMYPNFFGAGWCKTITKKKKHKKFKRKIWTSSYTYKFIKVFEKIVFSKLSAFFFTVSSQNNNADFKKSIVLSTDF